MDLHKRQQDWEDEAPHIAATGRGNPFLVPDGYFEELPQSITDRIILDEAGVSKSSGLTVPEGYFEFLPEKIEAAVAVEKLKEEVDTHGYSTPAGYFDSLSERIQQQTVRKETKVRRLIPAWAGYAAAACITLAVGAALVFNYADPIGKELSKVPDQEIENYLALYADQADTQVILENLETEKAFNHVSDNFSAEELQQYLEETPL